MPDQPKDDKPSRPRGFRSHRYDFDKPKEDEAPPPPPPERPKGFKPTKVAGKFVEGLPPGTPPKGFKPTKRT